MKRRVDGLLREEERERGRRGGKTRPRLRGWLKERGRASAGANVGGEKQGGSQDQEGWEVGGKKRQRKLV